MTDPYGKKLRYIESNRLRLLAATGELIAEDLKGREELAAALGVSVPQNWPPELYDRNAMDFAATQLRDPAERGWSFWYLVKIINNAEELLGICGFKGRPDRSGTVEIGYSILKQFRNSGFATEAASRLVAWAFGHANVKEVRAETLPHLRQSIRVLEKSGFSFSGPGSEHGVIRYTLQRAMLD
jgi:RimJ/RimL family protein N-acetyltransferase